MFCFISLNVSLRLTKTRTQVAVVTDTVCCDCGLKYANTFYCYNTRGRISLLVVCWAHCPVLCSIAGSILDAGNKNTQGIFPLELTWVLTPFPQNSFG